MQTDRLGAVVWEDRFDGYVDSADMLLEWTELDTASIATLALATDGIAAGGQGQHARLTVANTSGSAQTVGMKRLLRGVWCPEDAPASIKLHRHRIRYRISAGLAGCTVLSTVGGYTDNATTGVLTTLTAVCDGAWHEVEYAPIFTGFEFGVFFGHGLQIFIGSIPAGASGTIDLDDCALVRDEAFAPLDTTAPVFPFALDWSDPFLDQLSWGTEILAGDDESEQRFQLRLEPQRTIQFTVTALDAPTAAAIDAFVRRYGASRVAIPRWVDRDYLTLQANAGQAQLWLTTLSIAQRQFRTAHRAVLLKDATTFEAFVVNDWLGEGQVLVAGANLAATWPVGTPVYPLHVGRFASVVEVERPTNGAARYAVSFRLEDGR